MIKRLIKKLLKPKIEKKDGKYVYTLRGRKLRWLSEHSKLIKLQTELDMLTYKRDKREKWLGSIIVDNKKVLFWNYQYDYDDNQKYIAEELQRRRPDIDIVWVVRKHRLSHVPQGMRAVVAYSDEHLKEQLAAKVWVDNAFSCIRLVPKKANQVYIETWHASAGFKRIGLRDGFSQISRAEVDYVIASCALDTMIFQSTVWPDSKILELGHPRNDILFDKTVDYGKKVRDFFGLSSDTKLLLYAPTFRSGGNSDPKFFLNQFDLLNDALESKFGGKWAVLLRMHHKDRKVCVAHKSKVKVLDANTYKDIQELLIACDVGISDYSSWMNQMLMIRKPVFIYASDLEQYQSTRGFMFPLESTPIPIAIDEDELWQNIKSFDVQTYEARVDEFLTKNNFVDDGHASQRVVDLIEEIVD